MKYRVHKPFKVRKRSLKVPQGVSKEETELCNTIHLDFPTLPIYRSNRQILHGKEIDIWMPTIKVGIEYDGLAFHSSDSKDPSYHLYKTLECEKQGIRLIHIFSDEWETKKPLVVDLVRKVLGKYQTINAEDCSVYPIGKKEGKYFIDNSDLLGDCLDSTNYLALKYINDIVGVMSYHEEGDTVIIDRYTERRTIKVKGGLKKCLESFENKNFETRIDRRLYIGEDFLECGFIKTQATPPNYYYTLDFQERVSPNVLKLTEAQAKAQGILKIWDCGEIIMNKFKDSTN